VILPISRLAARARPGREHPGEPDPTLRPSPNESLELKAESDEKQIARTAADPMADHPARCAPSIGRSGPESQVPRVASDPAGCVGRDAEDPKAADLSVGAV
jgi:hypothetical protein